MELLPGSVGMLALWKFPFRAVLLRASHHTMKNPKSPREAQCRWSRLQRRMPIKASLRSSQLNQKNFECRSFHTTPSPASGSPEVPLPGEAPTSWSRGEAIPQSQGLIPDTENLHAS